MRNIEMEPQDTIGSLRTKVEEEFGLMPSDQDLRFGDVVLSNPLSTLESFGINEGSVIDFLQTGVKKTKKEKGFEGTGLLS